MSKLSSDESRSINKVRDVSEPVAKGNPSAYPMEVEHTARLLEKLEPKNTARIRTEVVRSVSLCARHTWVEPKCHSDNNVETFSLADHRYDHSQTELGLTDKDHAFQPI